MNLFIIDDASAVIASELWIDPNAAVRRMMSHVIPRLVEGLEWRKGSLGQRASNAVRYVETHVEKNIPEYLT